jgi:hypothetical protein
MELEEAAEARIDQPGARGEGMVCAGAGPPEAAGPKGKEPFLAILGAHQHATLARAFDDAAREPGAAVRVAVPAEAGDRTIIPVRILRTEGHVGRAEDLVRRFPSRPAHCTEAPSSHRPSRPA